MIHMAFDKKLIKYRGRPVITRYDNIRNPDLRPQLKVQVLDPFESGDYGPVQLIFDLYNVKDPKKSKPLAFANLDIHQVEDLISELLKALSVLDYIRTPEEIIRSIIAKIQPWYYRNRRKIETGAYVEG